VTALSAHGTWQVSVGAFHSLPTFHFHGISLNSRHISPVANKIIYTKYTFKAINMLATVSML